MTQAIDTFVEWHNDEFDDDSDKVTVNQWRVLGDKIETELEPARQKLSIAEVD